MLTIASAVILFMIYGVAGLTFKQDPKLWIKLQSKSVTFKCEVTGLGASNYVHWYHKKDGGTFKRLLYISNSGVPTIEAKDFGAEKKGNSYELKINAIKKEHAGVYYCASWDGSHGAEAFEPQQKISLTEAEEKLAIIDCFFPSDCWSYIHWYQQKDGETLKRMLYADIRK